MEMQAQTAAAVRSDKAAYPKDRTPA